MDKELKKLMTKVAKGEITMEEAVGTKKEKKKLVKKKTQKRKIKSKEVK
jgi:hypothetical protein